MTFMSALLYINDAEKYPVCLALKLFTDPGIHIRFRGNVCDVHIVDPAGIADLYFLPEISGRRNCNFRTERLGGYYDSII